MRCIELNVIVIKLVNVISVPKDVNGYDDQDAVHDEFLDQCRE